MWGCPSVPAAASNSACTWTGKSLWKPPVLKDGSSVPVKAAVEGGRKLEIRVDDAGDGNAADWGIIANAF